MHRNNNPHQIPEPSILRQGKEHMLQGRNEAYWMLVNGSCDSMTQCSIDGTLLFINRAGARNLGGVPADFVARSIYELLPQMAEEIYKRYDIMAVSAENQLNEDYISELPGGGRFFVSVVQPIRNLSGDVFATQAISHDITPLKRVERILNHLLIEYDVTEEIPSKRKRDLRSDIDDAIGALRTFIVESLLKPMSDGFQLHTVDSPSAWEDPFVLELYNALTPREKTVLGLTAKGLNRVEMAAELDISPRTAEAHRANVMRKMGVHNRAELVRCSLTVETMSRLSH